jgi:undecaprenyl diphosphate synthase
MSFKEKINLQKLPRHIAIIMDGNGRWAKTHGKPRVFGHKNGVTSVRETTEAAAEIGIQYLTLYAFSTENWNRPKLEVSALMSLLVETIRNEINTLNKNDIRLNAIGNINQLPLKTSKALAEAIENTKNNKRMVLTLALNYSGRWEIANAAKLMAEDYKANKIGDIDLNQDTFKMYLNTAEIPDPEFLIRTSGELRISNYLLWQIAYSELYFTEKFWPDFRKEDLYEAIVDFQHRERRFGKTSEQIA